MAAIVARAHEDHVRVVAHIGRSRDVVDAVGAGVDALMHDVYVEPITPEEVAAIARAHVPVVVTIGIWDAAEELGALQLEKRSAITREIAKPAVLKALSAFPNERERTRFSAMGQPLALGHAARRSNMAALRAAGVTILAGSDIAAAQHIARIWLAGVALQRHPRAP